MAILREQDKQEVRRRLSALAGPVKMIFFKEALNCETCAPAEELVRELAGLSDQIELITYNRVLDAEKTLAYGVDKSPALVLEGPAGARVRFYGIPGGYEFATLLEALHDAAAGKAELAPATRRKLAGLASPVRIQVFVTPSCPFCPGAVRTAHKLAVEFPQVVADMVEAQEFPELSTHYGVTGVPKVVINDKVEFSGAQPEAAFADAVLAAAG